MKRIINFLVNDFKWQVTFLICTTLLCYGFLVNNLNLWLDEIYSVLMAKDNWKDMWGLLITEDSKPPLYYLYLKFILALFPANYEIWASHFASLLLLIIAQIFSAVVIQRDFGHQISLWVILLLFLMPYSLWLALEVRTYMLSSLLMMITAVYGLRLLRTPKSSDFFKFGLFTLLSLYTHYYCALWLMFFYGGIFYVLFKNHKLKNYGKSFIITVMVVALCFLPWLCVVLNTALQISHYWYVNLSFVNFSWQFFINPLQPDILQSVFVFATIFSSAVFSFILLLGTFGIKSKQNNQAFWLLFGSFVATYILLLFCSYAFRPMVTSRYLKIYSLILYLAVALVISYHKEIQKVFIAVSLIGFCFTWADVRAIAFDKGYQTAISDIRRFIPNDKPLLALDNSNLFCEYYLPEYTCLLVTDGKGEILRKDSVIKNFARYNQNPDSLIYSLSIYTPAQASSECQIYHSDYRNGQNVNLCRFSADDANHIIQTSREAVNRLSNS